MIIDRYIIQDREQLQLRNVMNQMLGDPTPYDKERFWNVIDKWKAYLSNEYGLRKGQLVGLGVSKNNVKTTALVMACAELGAQVFSANLAWNPKAKVPMVATDLPASFGFWDSLTLKMLNGVQEEYYEDTVEVEMINLDTVDIENYNEPIEFDHPDVLPDDPLWVTYSDGQFEDGFEYQYYTHKECWGLAHRHYKLFNMKDTIGVHSFNVLHGMSFITYTCASFMGSAEHYFVNWWDRVEMWQLGGLGKALKNVFEMDDRKVIFFKNVETLEVCTRDITPEQAERIQFVSPMGVITPELHDLCDERQLRCVIMYGETRSKCMTLFVKPIKGSYVENSVGFIADNYYEVVHSPQKNVCFVRSHNDTKYYPLSFKLEKLDNAEYVFKGFVEVHPFQERVERILGHDNFWLLRKNALNYLAVFEEPSAHQMKMLDTLGLTDIGVSDKMAFCLENNRYRDWHALKNQFEYGFDEYEVNRVRYLNSGENE